MDPNPRVIETATSGMSTCATAASTPCSCASDPNLPSIENALRLLSPLVGRDLRFDGADYVPARDNGRLTRQLERIQGVMGDGEWRSLAEIEAATGDPPASISAQLRHLRKPRFGSHTVDKRYEGNGLYRYRLTI